MKQVSSGANCDGSRKRWPICIWNWCWSRRSWRWPVRNWTRAWRHLKKSTLAVGAPGGRSRPGVEVTRLCELAKMTPQNYYARRKLWRRQEVDVQLVLELARAERVDQPRLGVRKLYHLIGAELKAAGVKM